VARLYPHKVHGWRIEYRIYYKDGSSRLKTKYSKGEDMAQSILNDANYLEGAIRLNALSKDEAVRFIKKKILDMEDLDNIPIAATDNAKYSDDDVRLLGQIMSLPKSQKDVIKALVQLLCSSR
jgi:hypothetical protein